MLELFIYIFIFKLIIYSAENKIKYQDRVFDITFLAPTYRNAEGPSSINQNMIGLVVTCSIKNLVIVLDMHI